MLFKTKFKRMIRDGTVDLTFRVWKAARVVEGNSYRLGPDDAVVVEAVDEVPAGGLVIDVAARTVTVRDEPVELTTAEFDILHALASNAGRVLGRERLLEIVHGEGWAAYDRSVDVHVSRIRQKIEDDPRKPALLKTVRGVGYQLARTEPS